eukprot:SAG31_NODE_34813_length_329_cov_0.582609_1_plen_20_part_10
MLGATPGALIMELALDRDGL